MEGELREAIHLFLSFHNRVNIFSRKTEDTTEEASPLFLNSRPEVVYQVIQSVFFGALAISTLRFKFLWTPHMCLFAAGVFCNQSFWKAVLNKIGIKHIYVSILVRVSLAIMHAVGSLSEDLRTRRNSDFSLSNQK